MDTSTTTALAEGTTGESAQDLDRQLVVFRLAQERYGVDIGTVREIIRRQAVTHMPSAPDAVEGMINLRGSTIPVVDLCKRLNLSRAEDTDASRIIVLDTGEADIGVIVDEVAEVLRVSQDSISEAASIAASSGTTYIDGIAQVGDSLLMVLDLDDALSTESMRAFKAKEFAPPPAVVDESEAPDAADAAEVDELDAAIDEAEPTAAAVPPSPAADEAPVVEAPVTDGAPAPEESAALLEPAPDEPGEDPAGADLPFDIDLVQSTFELLAPRGDELVETFYALLLERHPAVAPLFDGVDMEQQRAKLLSALATVVASLRDLDTLVPHLQDLGRRHAGYGAEPAHYDAVGATLLDSIAQIAGDAWTSEVAAAWAGACGVAASVMKEAAEAVTEETEAA